MNFRTDLAQKGDDYIVMANKIENEVEGIQTQEGRLWRKYPYYKSRSSK